MNAVSGNIVWRIGALGWVLIACSAAVTAYMIGDGLAELWKVWNQRDEYSHGFFIPVISAFLIWQRKDELERMEFTGAWSGLLVLLAGVAVFFIGDLSALWVIVQYALIIIIAGLVLSYTGWRAGALLWVPVLFLVFMIPLPPFLYNNLSGKLQLLSSSLGVEVIRWFDISVFLEGNVIDLGVYKLQVVEACNGLRYLFPLTSFGFICAYLFKAPFWQRVVVFLSSVPITVFMNSFRIGMIGVLVEYWGIEQAEGFLHDFEGWVIFMASVAILFLEMWLFVRFTGGGRSFRDAFGIEFPNDPPADAEFRTRPVPKPFMLALVVLLGAAIAAWFVGEREETVPDRESFDEFPLRLGDWEGRRDALEDIYIEFLRFADYALIDYRNSRGDLVNFYSAYYASQRTGEAAHSPRACIPGGGWEIRSLEEISVDAGPPGAAPLTVNRLQIQKDRDRQLVYYWFQQRGRSIASEYLVKWYLLRDSITRNRTDGALVRMTTSLGESESWADADARLVDFVRLAAPELPRFVPD